MFDILFSWEALWYIMMAIYVPSCIWLIVIVLLQKGKGSGFAGAFGIGAGSDTVFGPRASKSLPQKLTHGMAAIFMLLALSMSLFSGKLGKGSAPDKVVEDQMTASEIDIDALDDLGSAVEDAPAEDAVPITVTPPAPPPAEIETEADLSVLVGEEPAAEAAPAEPIAESADAEDHSSPAPGPS